MTPSNHRSRQIKSVRGPPASQNPKQRIGKQNDCAHHREGELKTGGKEFVRIPAEKKKSRGGEAVENKDFSFEKETAEQDRSHYRGAYTRNVQSRDCRIKR